MSVPRIIAIASQKGGTGKTTTAINLGAYLAIMGKKVLLVDLDPQANMTMGLGLDHQPVELAKRFESSASLPKAEPREPQATIYDVLHHPERGIQDSIQSTEVFRLQFVPSSLDLVGAEAELTTAPDRAWRLQQALSSCRTDFDFILIDTPPSLGLFTQNALLACTEVIVPLQVHYFSLRALDQLRQAIGLMFQYNSSLRISGIVCTMCDRRNMLSKVIEEKVRQQFGQLVFKTVIPMNIALAEAPAAGRPVSRYDRTSSGAQAYDRLALEVATRV